VKVGELEIVVSLKGASDVGTGLTHVHDGMQDVKSMALETKAAILGVIYGLEQMASQSLHAGLGLQKFGNLTGLNTVVLQKWQYALQQSGVEASETESAIVNLQSKMAEVIVKGTGVTGMQPVFEAVGIDEKRIRDTYYVLGKLREFAQSHQATPDITRTLMQSLLPPDVIQALMTGTFNPENAPKSQIYGDRTAQGLAQSQIALTNLKTKLEHEFGQLTVKFAPTLIPDIDRLATSIFHLVDAFSQLLIRLNAIKAINSIFSGWSQLFQTAADLIPSSTNKQTLLPSSSNLDYFLRNSLTGILGTAPVGTKTLINNSNTTVHAHGMDANEMTKLIKDTHSKATSNAFRDINSVSKKQNN